MDYRSFIKKLENDGIVYIYDDSRRHGLSVKAGKKERFPSQSLSCLTS